jgi:two-component system sensor histidine kinase AlgZ
VSINQNANAGALPNFHNLGILLRILVIVDGICLAAAMLVTIEPPPLMERLIDISAIVQPILLLSLLTLAAMNNWLHRLRYQYAITVVVLLSRSRPAFTSSASACLRAWGHSSATGYSRCSSPRC